MPGWAKDSLDRWTVAGGFATGKIMRPVNKAGQLAGESMTPQSIFEVVERYSVRLGVRVAPHALRRTFAKLAHKFVRSTKPGPEPERRLWSTLRRRKLFVPVHDGVLFVDQPFGKRDFIRFLPFTGGPPVDFHELSHTAGWGITASPDGRQIAFAQYDVSDSNIMLIERFQ